MHLKRNLQLKIEYHLLYYCLTDETVWYIAGKCLWNQFGKN
jgi:hypothetical protein